MESLSARYSINLDVIDDYEPTFYTFTVPKSVLKRPLGFHLARPLPFVVMPLMGIKLFLTNTTLFGSLSLLAVALIADADDATLDAPD